MTLPSDDQIDNALLDRYIAGECSAFEIRRVHGWMTARPAMGDVVQQLRTEQTDRAGFRGDVEADWARVKERLEQRRTLGPQAARTNQSPTYDRGATSPAATTRAFATVTTPRWKPWHTLASVSLGVIAVLLVGWYIPTASPGAHEIRTNATYVTGNGERANITLPDGSGVLLNVASWLEVPEDYLSGNHTLRLTGEALFTIQHHAGAPLTVRAGQTTARVLGTSFAMRHYTMDSLTTVAVRDGKVSVQALAYSSIIVSQGRLVEVGAHRPPHERAADAGQFSFANGVLTLNDVPFSQAVIELSRWNNADIRLGDSSLARRRMAGQFPAGSVSDVSTILQWTYNLRVVRKGRVYTLFER